MIQPASVAEMLKFFRLLNPTYTIHLTNKNKITNFDANLVSDFQPNIIDIEALIGQDIIKLAATHKKYSEKFAETLANIIKTNGTGLCAINASFKDCITLKVPSIYILFIMIEPKIVAGNKVKELKIFNYIEVAKFLSTLSRKSILCPFMHLTKSFQDSIQEKSLFFAFESLKAFGTFLSCDEATKINQQNLADILFPYHKTRNKEINQRFVNQFLRAEGYVEYDKNRKIKNVSLEVLERIKDKHLIPFNSLKSNFIIQLS